MKRFLFELIISLNFCSIALEVTGFALNDGKTTKCLNGLVVNLPELGRLRGSTVRTARTNETVFQFLNVKYAESPKGRRRFKVNLVFKIAM